MIHERIFRARAPVDIHFDSELTDRYTPCMPKLRKPSVSLLKKKLDALFSRWIRIRASDDAGYASCFTCGARRHYKEMQAGHYVPRNIGALRYEPRNVHVQCVGCNMFNKGRLDMYAVNLERLYGQGILQWLAARRKTIHFSTTELQKMIDHYQSELRGME